MSYKTTKFSLHANHVVNDLSLAYVRGPDMQGNSAELSN